MFYDKVQTLISIQNDYIMMTIATLGKYKFRVITASLKASMTVVYSASMVDNAIVNCNVECQQTVPPTIVDR